MNILNTYPPNIDKIREIFNVSPDTIFTYGNTLHNPTNGIIDDALMVHEQTHATQQGDDPELWWSKYLHDQSFRFKQELEAYRNQYRKFKAENSRNEAFLLLNKIAKDFSGEMYGYIVDYHRARKLIAG